MEFVLNDSQAGWKSSIVSNAQKFRCSGQTYIEIFVYKVRGVSLNLIHIYQKRALKLKTFDVFDAEDTNLFTVANFSINALVKFKGTIIERIYQSVIERFNI